MNTTLPKFPFPPGEKSTASVTLTTLTACDNRIITKALVIAVCFSDFVIFPLYSRLFTVVIAPELLW